MITRSLTQSELKTLIHYDPETGRMIRLVSPGPCIKVGDEVKGKSVRGYRRAMIHGVRYKAHDLVWLYMTGSFPKEIIDHIDCNTDNLKWNNLREATQIQNCHNKSVSRLNTSGYKGVKWHKGSQKWCGVIGYKNRRIFVGNFDTKEAAFEATRIMREKLYGEFANHGVRRAA